MPILELEYVRTAEQNVPAGLAQSVADAAGEIFESSPGSTWVKVRSLAPENYAENGSGVGRPLTSQEAPVFVRVLLATPPDGERRAECARSLADAVARCIGRPAERVHILFEPAAAGRIAFGGVLRR